MQGRFLMKSGYGKEQFIDEQVGCIDERIDMFYYWFKA